MKLSGEMFQEIISQLTSYMAAGQHNKRTEPRVGIRATGFIMPWTLDGSGGKPTQVMVRDLSPGGICVLSPVQMQRGIRFVLQLPRNQDAPLLVNYEVRYCKPLTASLYAIGGKIVSLGGEKDEAA